MNKLEVLKKYFGYDSFRVGQEEVIDAIFDKTVKGVLVVMPTASGKSLLFQLPALMCKHMTVVISPLISLMKDQVDYLKSRGISAELYNTSLNEDEKTDIINKLRNQEIKILYISPERFDDGNFVETLKNNKIAIFAIDESHSISTWSNFRPAYRKIKKAVFELGPGQIIALTATATKKVQNDICNQIGAPNAKRFIKGFFRPDLSIQVIKSSNRIEKICDEVEKYHKDGIRTGIVYVGKRKDASTIVEILKDEYDINSTFYHAGMKDEERTETQNNWIKNGGLIVATTAMGMGIDKRDVRFIFHAYIPGSIEDYYQQIGRASRDGLGGDCRIFTNITEDIGFLKWMIDTNYPDPASIEKFWKYLNNTAKMQSGIIQLSQEEMGKRAGINPTFASGCISYLRNFGLIRRIENKNYEVNYFDNYMQAPLDFESLKEMRKYEQEKMLEIIDFVNERNTCRMVKILDYFDDRGSKPCGKCDICKKRKYNG